MPVYMKTSDRDQGELTTFFSIIRLNLMSKGMFSFLALWNLVY